MASRKRVTPSTNKRSVLAAAFAVVFCACAFVGAMGYSIASADRVGSSTSFGLNAESTFRGTVGLESLKANDAAASEVPSSSDGMALSERSTLATVSYCDISAGLQQLSIRIEEERRAAEEAARIDEQNHIAAALAAQAKWPGNSSLSSVDFTVGKAAFIEEWTARIDAYLAGSPLAGYGSVFAEAAWEYSIDPRWSPAISNTESSKGRICFLPHNAWGWGDVSFSNWTDAIWTHVAGLSKGYGYSITQTAARVYCPPNSTNWYYNTLSEMARI